MSTLVQESLTINNSTDMIRVFFGSALSFRPGKYKALKLSKTFSVELNNDRLP